MYALIAAMSERVKLISIDHQTDNMSTFAWANVMEFFGHDLIQTDKNGMHFILKADVAPTFVSE